MWSVLSPWRLCWSLPTRFRGKGDGPEDSNLTLGFQRYARAFANQPNISRGVSLPLIAIDGQSVPGQNFEKGLAIRGKHGFARQQKYAADFKSCGKGGNFLRIECCLAECALGSLDGLVFQRWAKLLCVAGGLGGSQLLVTFDRRATRKQDTTFCNCRMHRHGPRQWEMNDSLRDRDRLEPGARAGGPGRKP